MSSSRNFAGIVLAGGLSTRMGADKASLQIRGRSMLSRIVSMLRSIPGCQNVIVVSAANQSLPPLPDGTTIATDRSPRCGPLEGFATGLATLQKQSSKIDVCFLTSCDAPFLSGGFVTTLIDECWHNFNAAVPVYDEFPQPLVAAYSTRILPTIDELLVQDQRSMKSLLGRIQCKYVNADALRHVDPELLSLKNLNTPEDFAWAIQTAEKLGLLE